MLLKSELAIVRAAYAKCVVFAADVKDPRIESALAHVRREDFLGQGPWQVSRTQGEYRKTPTADPVYLCQDVTVGIVAEKGLNNGQPSLVAFLISLARLKEGEHVVHIGAGLGYYTALIAELVGASGRVTAIEYESVLAARAKLSLAAWSNVQVINGDGASVPLDSADVVLVNAGAVEPADNWLDSLKEGGRLILPLTFGGSVGGDSTTQGGVFVIERHGSEYSAHFASLIKIYPCVGLRDQGVEVAVASAFVSGGWDQVTRFYRAGDIAEDNCWIRTEKWALAFS